MYKICAWALLATFFSGPRLFAQSSWELKKDKDSVRIYTRTLPDSKFNELRAEFNLHGNFIQLRKILQDVEQYPAWVYATKTSKLVEKHNANELVYYAEITAPWPISNRDYYSVTRIWLDSADGKMHILSHNLPGAYPEMSHIVRIPLLKAVWTISPLSAGWIHVEYMLDWNPGGSIPAWLANLFSTTGPSQSFGQLRKKMAQLNP